MAHENAQPAPVMACMASDHLSQEQQGSISYLPWDIKATASDHEIGQTKH